MKILTNATMKKAGFAVVAVDLVEVAIKQKEEVSKVVDQWDDKYAPPDWDYERDGRPDIYYMELKK